MTRLPIAIFTAFIISLVGVVVAKDKTMNVWIIFVVLGRLL